jgi:hypothetical protein
MYMDAQREPTIPSSTITIVNVDICKSSNPYGLNNRLIVEMKDSGTPYKRKYPTKNTHTLRFCLNNEIDYFKDVFDCLAPREGGVGGFSFISPQTNAKQIPPNRNSPAYR